MTKYTIETLKDINASYDHQHGVTESDVIMVNELVQLIENTRNDASPRIGDVVQYVNKYGNYYEHAHIEQVKGSELYVCEKPMTPFITSYGNTLSTNTSGGAWSNIPSNLKRVGTEEKAFVEWGHGGARANGAVRFLATVNVWEYTEGEHEFTTKTHDKFFVSVREQENSYDSEYYITKDGSPYAVMSSDSEYNAWLKTYHGVERDGFNPNSRIVWAYKQKSLCVPLEEYKEISNAVIDSELNNATIQECKRVYEGTSVTTYMPYQNERIALPGKLRYMNAV